MDSIINKLTEIETAASAIVTHAEVQKEALDREYEQKRRQFDEQLEAETQAKLREIRQQLEADTKELLDRQAGSNIDSIRALEEEYEARHTDYAKEILKRITEV